MNISGVEFKSMPSGLHNVTEDLVYFTPHPTNRAYEPQVLCDAAVRWT